jgi:predicted flavoprotein YhiN
VIVGAGAAGLFCAGIAGQRGLRVLLLDHSDKVAEKIRISGGGRANFSNRDLDPHAPHRHFISANPTSAARRCRATHRPTSSAWCSATASPSTKSTRASCSATARPKT